MKQTIEFIKMHGLGNDYIYVDMLDQAPLDHPELLARQWSKHHTGIGSDGLVLIGAPSDAARADFSMRIFNADGSEAMMCGNASRCIGKYLYESGRTSSKFIRLETLSGVRTLELHLALDNTVETVTVDMGEPLLTNPVQYIAPTNGVIAVEKRQFHGTFVSMGNPHYVLFEPITSDADVTLYGRALEHDAAFPERSNIEFVQIEDLATVRMRVWERGSGITQACGTGACATAVAAIVCQNAHRQVRILMDGGALDVEWREGDNHVYMTGTATEVFRGTISL